MQDRNRTGPLHDDSPRFVSEGVLSGTPVATPQGWCRIDDLAPGDAVLTFDDVPKVVQAIQTARVEAGPGRWPRQHWPLLVPDGVLENHGPLRLLPDQAILLVCDLAEAMFGDPFVVVPAMALQGWRGIAPSPPLPQETAFQPVFAEDEVIYAAGGTLICCPADAPVGLPGFGTLAEGRAGRVSYPPLSLASARDLVACLIAEDVGAALIRATPRGPGQATLRVSPP